MLHITRKNYLSAVYFVLLMTALSRTVTAELLCFFEINRVKDKLLLSYHRVSLQIAQ